MTRYPGDRQIENTPSDQTDPFHEIEAYLRQQLPAEVSGSRVDLTPRDLVILAKRTTDPQNGGDPLAFQNVNDAEARLREQGLL